MFLLGMTKRIKLVCQLVNSPKKKKKLTQNRESNLLSRTNLAASLQAKTDQPATCFDFKKHVQHMCLFSLVVIVQPNPSASERNPSTTHSSSLSSLSVVSILLSHCQPPVHHDTLDDDDLNYHIARRRWDSKQQSTTTQMQRPHDLKQPWHEDALAATNNGRSDEGRPTRAGSP